MVVNLLYPVKKKNKVYFSKKIKAMKLPSTKLIFIINDEDESMTQ